MHEWVLTNAGRWEWEPRPSERTDEFITATRFNSVDAAHEAFQAIQEQSVEETTR